MNQLLYIGIKGHVLAIDSATGSEIWRTKLAGAMGGSSYVTVYSDAGGLYAGSQGELFCLDRTTGSVLWKNELTGLGYNLITFAGSDVAAAVAEIAQKQAAGAAAGAAAAGA